MPLQPPGHRPHGVPIVLAPRKTQSYQQRCQGCRGSPQRVTEPPSPTQPGCLPL